VLSPWSLPRLVAATPTMTRAASVVVANCRLYAGRNPPSAIFMTRASGSVVDTRTVASLVLRRALVAVTSGTCARAASRRASRFSAPRFWAATRRALISGSAASRVTASRCARASAISAVSVASRRNEAAPALARTRVPSWAIRLRSTKPCFISNASTWLIRVSSTVGCWLRKSLRV